MPYERLAYDDQDTARKMHDDCAACSARMPRQRAIEDITAPPSLEYDEFPREARKPQISVSDAAAHLAARLHLHLN